MAADAELNLSFIEKKLGTVGRIAYYAGLVGLYSLIPLIKNDLGAIAGGFLEGLGVHPERIVEIEEFGDFSSSLHGIIGLVLQVDLNGPFLHFFFRIDQAVFNDPLKLYFLLLELMPFRFQNGDLLCHA